MDQDNMYLTNWYPGWLRDDDVDLENQASLKEDLCAFIRGPFGRETFTSVIPFRIIGRVHNHPEFSGDDIATSFVKEIRRVISSGTTTPTFDVVTLNSVYRIELGESTSWYIKSLTS